MNPGTSSTRGRWQTWKAPLLFALVTALGLMSALLGEQLSWKVIAWLALGIPVVTSIGFAWLRRS
jgi:hypothetical protein